MGRTKDGHSVPSTGSTLFDVAHVDANNLGPEAGGLGGKKPAAQVQVDWSIFPTASRTTLERSVQERVGWGVIGL